MRSERLCLMMFFLAVKANYGKRRKIFLINLTKNIILTDVCALTCNAKCKNFFTPEIDGLKQSWDGKVCFCNPPYGREIGKWIEKAATSFATTVMLLPARTDTRWFHEWVLPQAEIHFLKGRLKFGGAKNGAPFPSMIVIFNNNKKGVKNENR